MNKKPVLYIKETCPWCQDAVAFFNEKGLDVELREINRVKGAREEMERLTGQGSVPSFVYGEFIVSDFDVDEFMEAVVANPEVRKELNL